MVVRSVGFMSGGWDVSRVREVWGSVESSIEGIIDGSELPTSVMLLVIRFHELGENDDKKSMSPQYAKPYHAAKPSQVVLAEHISFVYFSPVLPLSGLVVS